MNDDWEREIHTGNIRRVTAGKGGEALLISGAEKTALYDAGMACFGTAMLENLKKELAGRPLDFFLVSHIHYDHVGALPYVLQAYPGVKVLAGEYGERLVLPYKYEQIRELSEQAAKDFIGPDATIPPYDDAIWRVDRILKDGDEISLGGVTLRTVATPGHTRDCVAFYIPEWDLLLASETTGVWEGNGRAVVPFLTGYGDSIRAIERCRAIGAAHLFSAHSLELAPEEITEYWDGAMRFAEIYKNDLRLLLADPDLTDEMRTRILAEKYWIGKTREEQPYAAFEANTTAQLNLMRREFGYGAQEGKKNG